MRFVDLLVVEYTLPHEVFNTLTLELLFHWEVGVLAVIPSFEEDKDVLDRSNMTLFQNAWYILE